MCPKYLTSSTPKGNLDNLKNNLWSQRSCNIWSTCWRSLSGLCCRWECHRRRPGQIFGDMVWVGGWWGFEMHLEHYRYQMAWPRIHNGLHEFGRLSWECLLHSCVFGDSPSGVLGLKIVPIFTPLFTNIFTFYLHVTSIRPPYHYIYLIIGF